MRVFLNKYFDFIRKHIPSKPEGTAVGLDIGSGECKLVELIQTGNSYTLLNIAVEPVKNGDIKTAIEAILGQLTAPCKAPITAVFGKGTLIRYINMPKLSLEDLKKAFAIEADKYFPFSQDEIYTDCFIVEPQEKNNQVSVMVTAAKKELVDQRIKFLEELGLQADFIGVNPIALANAVNVLGVGSEEAPSSAIALLDLGDSVSNLTIFVNRLPRFTRDIFIGGREFSKRISNALGISFEEAEKLKMNPGDKIEAVRSACETAVMNMVQELRLSFDYFATEKNSEISKLLLTGGGSMLEGITAIFENNLEVKVAHWSPLDLLKVSPQVPTEELNKKFAKMGVALGLALYHYD